MGVLVLVVVVAVVAVVVVLVVAASVAGELKLLKNNVVGICMCRHPFSCRSRCCFCCLLLLAAERLYVPARCVAVAALPLKKLAKTAM